MPLIYSPTEEQQHTEEVQEIITSPPSWLLRWGITIFFLLLLLIVALAAAIRYPDTVKSQLRINSYNSPKPVVTKVAGKLSKILISENQQVSNDQVVAFLESTADHGQVLQLLDTLQGLQDQFFKEDPSTVQKFITPVSLRLGELQFPYQSFYQSYLAYKASLQDGFYLKKRIFLQRELAGIQRQKEQILAQRVLQEKDYGLAEQEYRMHQKLYEQKVTALLELRREESKFLTKAYPLQQTKAALLQNATTYATKEKEILELDNQIQEEKLKFIQALNGFVSEVESWKSKYVLSAPQSGTLSFSGIIQENQFFQANQELFYVSPKNTAFFGEMDIPQYNMGKVKAGQKVLVKLRSYPYEEYGVVWGEIEHISDVPFQDSVFVSKVVFREKDLATLAKPIKLKNGMLADAETITEEASLLGRLFRNINKVIKAN